MPPAAQGVYDTLWLESWNEKEAGVLPADDESLARLADVSMEVWEGVKNDVRNGFEVREKCWICRAVVRTKREQDRQRKQWRKRKGRSRIRERDVTGDVTSMSRVPSPVGSGVVGVGSGSGVEKIQNLEPSSPNGDLSLVAPLPKAKPSESPADRDWRDAFVRYVWPDYLALKRKCSKGDAFAVYMRIPHADPQPAFERLDNAYQLALAEWRKTDTQYVPHLSTWLNSYRKDLAEESRNGDLQAR